MLDRLAGRLVVSVQAQPGEPLHGASHMAAMARAAEAGGAAGIRAESPADVRAIRAAVGLPIVGLWKRGEAGVYITPTKEAARAVAEAGADAIALDATDRERPEPLAELIRYVHTFLGLPVLADVSTVEEGVRAALLGADAVAPTLAGYTGGPVPEEPAWDVLEGLVAKAPVPVWMEGRLWTPEQVAAAFAKGARTVVVGSAITRPQLITARFAAAAPLSAPQAQAR